MKQITKTLIIKRILLEIITIGFIFSLFFPIRTVLFSKYSYILGQFSDFTTIYLYLSDILLVFLLILSLFLVKSLISRENLNLYIPKSIFALVFWLIFEYLLRYRTNNAVSSLYFAKFLEAIVAYGTMYLIFRKTPIKSLFLIIFAIFGIIQSIISILQFWLQKPLGLFKLGEQHLDVLVPGFAKIIANGKVYLRGYGTFPHPNVLSAFLVVSALILVYLLQNSQTRKQIVLYGTGLLITILGLFSTFSRAGLLGLICGLAIYFGYFTLNKTIWTNAKTALLITLAGLVVSFFIFVPFLKNRVTIIDTATQERIVYAKAGFKMLKTHPLVGMGLGESLLHMKQFSDADLKPWQIQPIHNYFLLVAAEIGVIGALIIIWVIISHLASLIKKLKTNFTIYDLLLTAILVSFIVLMQFDHYFYTLQQTQMLLWIILGAISAEFPKKLDVV